VTLNGFLVLNKQAGMTSHSVVSRVRRLTGEKKAGHTGTLDPFATGVLPVALGEATKAIQFLDESEKEYCAVMRLGQSTDTQDCTGSVTLERDWHHVTPELLAGIAEEFTGNLLQIPPMFSAIKQNGVPLYRLARKGSEVERAARQICIHSLSIDKMDFPEVAFTVRSSRGTYVRTLAHDMGERLGCGAHLTSLCRTKSGPFTLVKSPTLDELADLLTQHGIQDLLLTPQHILSHLREQELNETAARRVAYGSVPSREEVVSGDWAVHGERVMLVRNGQLLAVAEGVSRNGVETLRLLRVFG